MRDQLRRLRQLAGSPTADSLHEYAGRGNHSVSRSALAAVTVDGDSAPRWATVEAFIDACGGYAKARGRPISAQELDMLDWRALYDRTYPGQRKSGRAPAALQQVGVVPSLADCFQPRALV